ncbi:glycosyltransferase [Candidatus Poriferisodalis sp.]|uniref:glycosyltransferase n=1 Tax=Candidatus Poriferisodalis sp. TaxID=3101277 RepID=UPI003B01AA0D
MTHAVAIVPAYNRADTVGATVTALRTVPDVLDVIVVDDGSADSTASVAAAAGARVVEFARNRGKGDAIAAGVAASGAPEVYLLIDADLGDSAALAGGLLEPVAQGLADMAIAVLGPPDRPSGFGLVKALAAQVARAETGLELAEPLSGQRAVRGSLLRSVDLAERFGLEFGLTLDASARGATIREIEIAFEHRPSGRDLSGFVHRARIGRDVWRAAVSRAGCSKTVFHLAASLLSRVRTSGRRRSQPASGQRRRLGRRMLSRRRSALRSWPGRRLRSLRQPSLRNATSRLRSIQWRRIESRLGVRWRQRARTWLRLRLRRSSNDS